MMHRIWPGIVLVLLAGGAMGEESADILRDRVDAAGAVDAALAEETGWTHVQGIRWRVQLIDPRSGRRLPPPADGKYATGQFFQVIVESQCGDAWVYLLNVGTSGKMTLLFPADGDEHVKVAKGQRITFPPDGNALRFSPPAGVETLRIIAAPEPLAWTDPQELFQMNPGTKSVTAAGLLSARQEMGSAKAMTLGREPECRASSKSLGEVMAQIRDDASLRSKDVSLMPPADSTGQQELIVVRAETPPAPLVVDLSLEHR